MTFVRRSLYVIALLMLGGCNQPTSTDVTAAQSAAPTPAFTRIPATDEGIAHTNLDFTIERFREIVRREQSTYANTARSLVSALLTRVKFKSSFADFDEAMQVANALIVAKPDDADGWLLLAEIETALHEFTAAREHVAKAKALGATDDQLLSRTASIAIATGTPNDVLPALQARAKEDPTYGTWTQLASALHELGDQVRADAAYQSALDAYPDVSPFAMAWVFYQRAQLAGESDPALAERLYAEALHYLPHYVAARSHLADLLAQRGDVTAAIKILREAVADSDDPEPKALLAKLLLQANDSAATQQAEAQQLVRETRDGYEALLEKHRLAFADHAALFYGSAGADPVHALELAKLNQANRDSRQARALLKLMSD